MWLLNIRARSLVKRPASDRLSDRLESFVACRRTEHNAKGTAPASRQPRPERIAEEVELLVGVISAPVIILAEDDFRLLGMKRQSAFGEPLLKRCAQGLCLISTAAVADRIIGITFERDARMVPPHPPVERVMKKEVGQERTDDPSLRRSSLPADKTAIRHLDGCPSTICRDKAAPT